MDELKPKFYMGAEALTSPLFATRHASGMGLKTYDTIEDALTAVSATVAESGKPRYIVQTVALVEPCPPPVKVTRIHVDERNG
jgi:hypothetical protein